ncbi:MAG: thermonuclease family protein [Desertimonas sp.]
MRAATTALALAALAAVVAGCTDRGGARSSRDGVGRVERVIDGDTIDVTIDGHDERVRLLGIDTPETKIPDTAPECYGPEASARTGDLLPAGTSVRLERDVVARDDYGRLLAYVYRLDDELLINEVLVRDGYARLLFIEPNGALRARLVAAARAAEAAGAGLWGACGG